MTALKFAELAAKAGFPKGVINIVPGSGKTVLYHTLCRICATGIISLLESDEVFALFMQVQLLAIVSVIIQIFVKLDSQDQLLLAKPLWKGILAILDRKRKCFVRQTLSRDLTLSSLKESQRQNK